MSKMNASREICDDLNNDPYEERHQHRRQTFQVEPVYKIFSEGLQRKVENHVYAKVNPGPPDRGEADHQEAFDKDLEG